MPRKDAAEKVFKKLLEIGVVAVTCRGVELDRLALILKNGVDVFPTNSPIWADFMDKAVKYGGKAQVVQVFDHQRLKRTFKEINAHADPSEIQKLKDTYRSWEISVDGNKFWCSMLPFEDGRRTTAYEIAYGWFIPDNPWNALIALAIFLETEQEREVALSLLNNWPDPTPVTPGSIDTAVCDRQEHHSETDRE
jgi:hypothetical protein